MENKSIKENILNSDNIINIDNKKKDRKINNKNFIKEIFEYSEEIKNLIPKFKINSEPNIIEFFNVLQNYSNDKKKGKIIENEEEENELLINNLRQIKNIFTQSTQIAENIQLNKNYYNEEEEETGMIGILYDLYIYSANERLITVLEEIFNILKKNENLSKIEFYCVFQKIAKEYFWEDKDRNNNFNNLSKYIDLLMSFLSDTDDLNQFDYFSFDLKKCDGIQTNLKDTKIISEGNTLNFQILFLTRNYQKNENTKLISIHLYQKNIDLILNGIDIDLYIDKKKRETMHFKINMDKWYKINFSLMNFKEDKIITIGVSEINKPKEEIRVKSTFFEGTFQLNNALFFENFQGNFAPISCFTFDYPRISFEGKIYSKNIFNLGDDIYWNKNIKDEKNGKDFINNKLYKNNIYFVGGMKIFLPILEIFLLNKNETILFKKYINLIKEVLIDKPQNLIDASNSNFFEVFGFFIEKLDNDYFDNEDYRDFLFNISDNIIKQIPQIKDMKYLKSFYISIFFKYEIITKIFHGELDQYFNYININGKNLYKFMKFSICGKFLNEIKYEKYGNNFYPFIQNMIKNIIQSNDENINEIPYYLLQLNHQTNHQDNYSLYIIKSLYNEILNSKYLNESMNLDFLINLSLFKHNNIENKFMIIQIFQLIYLKNNKKLNEIIVYIKQNLKYSFQIYQSIIELFFDIKFMVPNENKKKINKKYSKEDLMFILILDYVKFSINYIGDYNNVNIEKPEQFDLELYIKFISENLTNLLDLIQKENVDINLYTKISIKKYLINILVYSLMFLQKEYKEENNLNLYFTRIKDTLQSFLVKIVIEEINNNMNFKEKEKNGYLGFQTFSLIIQKYYTHRQEMKYKNVIKIIDELIKSSYFQITKIDVNQYDNIKDLKKTQVVGFSDFIKFIEECKDLLNILETINDKNNKFETVKNYFKKYQKKNFVNFFKNNFFSEFEKNKIEKIEKINSDLLKKLNEMSKLLNFISLIFFQYFFKNNIKNNELLNQYLIFLYIIINLGEYLYSNDQKIINEALKKNMMNNFMALFISHLQIISYLCLTNEKPLIYENIFTNIIAFSELKNKDEKLNLGYNEDILQKITLNLLHFVIPQNEKDKIKYFLINYIIKEEKKDLEPVNEQNIIWDDRFINLYNIINYSQKSIIQKKYIKIKKELFSFNGIYSNKKLFYTDKKKDFKFKISTHLTENLMNTLIIPILDFNYYVSNKYNFADFCSNEKKYINLSIFKNENENIDFKIPFNYDKIPCCLVKISHHIKGFILIKKNSYNQKAKFFEFFYSEKEEIKQNYESKTKLCYGSYSNIDYNIPYYIKIKIDDIILVFNRKYYYLDNSIEIFTNKNKSYFFTFNIENGKEQFINSLENFSLKIQRSEHQKNIILEEWKLGKISTFTFLNKTNILANRSLKDLTQFPVFPWIIHDYSIIKKDEKIRIRQLDKPMAQIELNNESMRKKNYQENYDCFKEDLDEKYKNYTMEEFYNDDNICLDDIPYYYGTHYSNPAYVSHYLNRIFPYVFTAWSIQGKSFDAPDRLFINIEKSYKGSTTSRSDLREIIPHFFFFPEMFCNLNKLNLGKLQVNERRESTYSILKDNNYTNNDFDEINSTLRGNDNISNNNNSDGKKEEDVFVNDVLMPNWSNNNYYFFTSIYREILELIKEDICEWVNLIFGVYSRGEKALEKKNLFMPYSYDNIIDKKLKMIKDPSEKICTIKLVELGLTPHQIYNEPITYIKEEEYKELDFSITLSNVKKIKYIKKGELENNLMLYTNDLNIIKIDLKNKESKIENCPSPFSSIIQLIYISKGKSNIILIEENNNKLIFKVSNNKFAQIMNENIPDKSLITKIYVDKNEDNLYVGTKNGSLIIYNMKEIINIDGPYNPKYYLNHSKKINNINVSNELNMLIDCSDDGYINLYTLPKIELVNSIYKENINYVFLSSSPLPSFVTYSNVSKYFCCYNINCKRINIELPYERVEIKTEDNNLIKEKLCKIEYYTVKNKVEYLKEDEINLDDAIVITNSEFVDFLLYKKGNFFYLRKFPFMVVTQQITFDFDIELKFIFDRIYIVDDKCDIKIIQIFEKQNTINIKSLNKSKIGKNLMIQLKEINI